MQICIQLALPITSRRDQSVPRRLFLLRLPTPAVVNPMSTLLLPLLSSPGDGRLLIDRGRARTLDACSRTSVTEASSPSSLSSAATDAAGTRLSLADWPHGDGNLPAGLRVVCRYWGRDDEFGVVVCVTVFMLYILLVCFVVFYFKIGILNFD